MKLIVLLALLSMCTRGFSVVVRLDLLERHPILDSHTEEVRATGRQSILDEGPRCLQPIKTGFCFEYKQRYAFNVITGICEGFVFAGCYGNLNNFETLAQCQTACGSYRRVK